MFLAELNNLQLWATNIGNAYLEAYITEKVYIIAGPNFVEREGHNLVISKALYGLRSSGARWHDQFADCIRELGFFPCKAEPDIWMRKNGNIYKYIAVYVDDVAIAMKLGWLLRPVITEISVLQVIYGFSRRNALRP
jgi:Reverse transcriptase (RNA-dependent DNA polymerase)